MKFRRSRILLNSPGPSLDVHGYPTVLTTVLSAEVTDLILGNGTAAFDGITTVAIPAAYNDAATFEININQNKQLFVALAVIDLDTVTSFRTVIEFNEPHNPDIWYPSKEGVARTTVTEAGNEWDITAVGNYVVASRIEHGSFTKARVRFRYETNAPDSDTRIHAYWYTDGGISALSE